MALAWCLKLFVVVTLISSIHSQYYKNNELYDKEKTASYWHSVGLRDIEEALQKQTITRTAKNVILFLGDGMGISTITAARIFKGQKAGLSGEEGYLTFDRLPNIALLKTYNVDKQVADSAGTATAFLTGVKGNYHTVGVTASVVKDDCQTSLKEEHRPQSILKWAQDADKDTGIVTNTRVTHATPAASYAASANRDWECDAKMKETKDPAILKCKDIARQLIEQKPGKNLNVLFGGGRQPLGAQFKNSTSRTCRREDGRNLVSEWLTSKRVEGHSVAYVTNTEELEAVKVENMNYIVGLFSESHLPFERNRDKSNSGQPSLKQMVIPAIKRLQRAKNGFVLLVEGGRIDHALHESRPQVALEEAMAFDEAIEAALNMVNIEETLVVVTADHSHGLTINGYPERGNSIIGTSEYFKVTDEMEYTTLMMATGSGYNYTWDGNKVKRMNVTGMDTNDSDFKFLATIPTEDGWSMHSGEDVAVFAAGPWSHLFHRVHEQNYVAHVIGYSANMGPYSQVKPTISGSTDNSAYTVNNSAQSYLVMNPMLHILICFISYYFINVC